MKKVVTGIAATLAISFSLNAVAVDRIGMQAQDRLKSETAEMVEIMDLDSEQAAKVLELKSQLFASNRDARNEHGAGTDAFNELRRENMQTYRQALNQTVTRKQMKAFRESRQS